MTSYLRLKPSLIVLSLAAAFFARSLFAQNLDEYRYAGEFSPLENVVVDEGRFNGYTNYWHDDFWKAFRYGNLFMLNAPAVGEAILQNKVDIAEELGIPGLVMQEGFIHELLRSGCRLMEGPSEADVTNMLKRANVLAYIDAHSELGEKLLARLPAAHPWKARLKSHQFNAPDFHSLNAFYLERGESRLFAVVSSCGECRSRFRRLLENVSVVIDGYALHRGWFGTGSLLHSVTIHPGHPLEIIGKGMNQGNSFFTFSGYMDYMLHGELPGWLEAVNCGVVADVGITGLRNGAGGVIYGCRDYAGLKIQDTPNEGAWINFAKSHGGYVFRPVYSPACDAYNYDGYIAIEGNNKQIDGENVPFILETGYIKDEAPPCMVLFSGKNEPLTKERMYEAIFDRRSVGILPGGKMLGPEYYRNTLQMLLLDRVWLEEYFGSRIDVAAEVKGYTLTVTLSNTYSRPVQGTLRLSAAPAVGLLDTPVREVALPARSSRTITIGLNPSQAATGTVNPIAVAFSWESTTKRTLAILDLPPAISVHRLIFGQPPALDFPVTLHNFTAESDVPVSLKVTRDGNPGDVVYETERNARVERGSYQTVLFSLPLASGSYRIHTRALNMEAQSQAGIGPNEGKPYVYPVDLDGDGIDEYRMENDCVRVTLLATGARIIEYIITETGENVFFKLWPGKSESDRRPFREREFYPYGGFEDFLGQGSMETHRVYDAEIIKESGSSVSVRMSADYFGNRIEKIYTLYGNSPLVEARFALDFINPEANMLGPQPILELGDRHWTEDLFIVPTADGLQEIRMRPGTGRRYGLILDVKEGWNAGYDPEADVSFLGAFPVSQPEFLHMFTNDPGNASSNFYYIEFQPWVPIFTKSVMYFSYYFWAQKGSWEKGLEELRTRNLITSR